MKSCIENNMAVRRRMHYLMNTFCQIEAEGDDVLHLEESIEDAFCELKKIEDIFSRYVNHNVISRINQNADKEDVQVDDEVFGLLKRSLEISAASDGAFDITIGAGVDLWRLAEQKNNMPAAAQIKEVRGIIGYKNLILDSKRETVSFAKPGMKLDLGAFAKGYALDKAVSVLKDRCIRTARLDLGGHIYILDNQPQTIAIRNPILTDEVVTTVELEDSSISTSADYERGFVIGNRRFSHLINPLSGMPVESDVLSVSVVSKDAALADAISTAMFVLGFERDEQILNCIEGIDEAIIIYKGTFGYGMDIRKIKPKKKGGL